MLEGVVAAAPRRALLARQLARRRLAALLLAHPILLHKRFVWAVKVRFLVAALNKPRIF
tara:strand:+ start:568 stop:744 length:177 start_codon:yes stop_codon:yes gene_type:complete